MEMKYLLIFLLFLFPAILSAVEVDLEWTDNSDNELGFEIERKPIGGEFEGVWTVFADVNKWTDDVEAGAYEYRVRAIGVDGYSGYTNNLEVAAGDPPNDPSGLERHQRVLSVITNADGSITVKPVNL